MGRLCFGLSDFNKAIFLVSLQDQDPMVYFERSVIHFLNRDNAKSYEDLNKAQSLGLDISGKAFSDRVKEVSIAAARNSKK